jgi:LMBR1 domain-containing protein 1
MVSWWLILIAVILAILVVGLVFYFFVLYSSEEDTDSAWLPKLIVIGGLSFAVFNVLLLPYDVANVQNPTTVGAIGGGINVELMWEIVAYVIGAMTVLVVPFCMFYYEAYEPGGTVCDQFKVAVAYTSCTVIVFVSALLIGWFTSGTADIPYVLYANNVTTTADPSNNATSDTSFDYDCVTVDRVLSLKVSLFVYVVGLLAAIGWFFFFVFGGVGLAALPMDLISDFRNRPKPITIAEYAAKKVDIGSRIAKLMEEGKELEERETKGETGVRFTRKKNQFKTKVQGLEDEYENNEISHKAAGGSVLQAYSHLVGGVLGVLLSLSWFLHILLNNFLQVTPFLNSLFIALDGVFSLFGVVAYGVFAFYMLWAAIKGCSKIGVNLLIFTVHPMKLNGTLMNSFLFNTNLVLLMSTSVVQFCTISFNEYASNTAVNMIYSTYVANLRGIGEITKYFQYPLLVLSVLTWMLLPVYDRCCKKCCEDDD